MVAEALSWVVSQGPGEGGIPAGAAGALREGGPRGREREGEPEILSLL